MAKLLLGLILLALIHGQQGCFEEERVSLLEFKANAKSSCPDDPDHLLPSWVEDDPKSDCCLWEGVTCANHTGHVIELLLVGTFGTSDCRQTLNLSIFQPFKELKVLYLSNNWFNDCIIGEEGCSSFLQLEQLETLDLSYNELQNNRCLWFLTHLTSLKHLSLAGNRINGSFPVQELSVFKNLETLDLSGNDLEGSLTMQVFENLETLDLSDNWFLSSLTMQELQNISRLSKLEYLNLAANSLSIEFMRLLVSLFPSLKSLILYSNQMEGSLSDQDLKTLTRLEILDLRWNNIVGNLPSNLGKLTSLKALALAGNAFNGSLPIPGLCELERLEELDLSGNSFEGMIPPCLNNMKSLRFIDLSDNHFEGSFTISSLANHSKLEMMALTCDGNKLKMQDVEYLDQNPLLFQLKLLKLSNCDMKNIPNILLHQHQLRVVDLSHNRLNGTFPTWLLENNIDLEFLNLRNNSLVGQFYVPTNMSNMEWVDVSGNDLSGQLQRDFGTILSNSRYINLSNNHLEGDLPSSICPTGNKLEALDLSYNNFEGEVPTELVTCCTNLEILLLSHNKFRGDIFSAHYFNLSSLSYLDLSNNQFTGSLANNARLSTWIDLLDISNNYMTAEIPSWICNLEFIGMLSLRRNSFKGRFPCKEQLVHVEYLDLSYNSLSGSLPYCFDQSLRLLNLEGNRFSGPIPSALVNFSALKVLNLRDNNLNGSIPNFIGTISSLRILSFGHNYLSGLIPKELCNQLENITILDLSDNVFCGPIPLCFSKITFGKIKQLTSDESQTFTKDTVDTYSPIRAYEIDGLLEKFIHFTNIPGREFEIDFVTKNRLYSYVGDAKYLMAGLDLSSNNLTGQIPSALGNLSLINALNLSHNRLVGSIPTSFSNLTEVESLDLSFNHLSGQIPLELANLMFLEVFNVTSNNLSGKIPCTKQFSTFEESSYIENPLLCGLPLNKNCTETPHSSMVSLDETDGKWFEVDSTVFYATFVVTYIMLLLCFMTVLFINPRWRRRWFLFVEHRMYSSYYFAYDIIGKLSVKFWN